MTRRGLLFAVIFFAAFSVGCQYTKEGNVAVETYKGGVAFVHPPGEVFYTFHKFNTDVYEVDVKPWTEDIDVYTATRDNANLKLKIRVSASVPTDFSSIAFYVRKFGWEQDERHKRRLSLLSGAMQGATRDAVNKHDAYSIYAEQTVIQMQIKEAMKHFLAEQMYSVIQDLQIVDRPDFEDDRIEVAASAVVAAKKSREAETELEQAAIVQKRRFEIENAIYSNSPQAFELKKLEWHKWIAQAWAGHQGTLIFGSDSVVQVPSR